MLGRGLLVGFGLAVVSAMLPVNTASAAQWYELNFYLFGPRYDGNLPTCDNRATLGTITAKFGDKESSFWNSKLKIQGFDQIRENAYRPGPANAIPRRFCSAVVHISDGSTHALVYSIAEDTGIIGATWGVEWCVVGLDRDWSYNPACKMAEP